MWLYNLNAMNHCLDWIHDFAKSFFVVFVVQGSRFVVFLDFLDISWTLDLLVGRSCWFPKLTVRDVDVIGISGSCLPNPPFGDLGMDVVPQ